MLKKVLVIDDSELIHKMYQLVLHRYNCEMVIAVNGQEALDILAVQCDFQLVLLDIHMPVMNGIEFMEKAKALGLTNCFPIIILSAEGKEEDTIKGLKLGARGYLKKPFKSTDLYDIIGKIFAQQEAGGEYECR
jgi:DNA-binding response OmpR family regulator